MRGERQNISSLEEYYVFFDEFEKLWNSRPWNESQKERFYEVMKLLDDFEDRMIPPSTEPGRTGGRF